MRSILCLSAATAVLITAVPAAGQGMDMPMHHHPDPAPKVDRATVRDKKPASPVKASAPVPKPATEAQPATPVHADIEEPMRLMDHAMPAPEGPSIEHESMGHDAMAHPMTGALGSYPMNREASGTSWQPDTSIHSGIQVMAGDWMLMGHAVLNGVYSWQEGPRGGDKIFASGMVMGWSSRGTYRSRT